MVKLMFYSLLCCVSVFSQAKFVLVTGEISSSQSQIVTAPKAERWNIMIQWLAEEGQVVNKGELVAVFDSGGIQSQLETNEEQLDMEKLELVQTEMRLNQAVIEAEGRLKLAEFTRQKTWIEASVEDGDVSAFDKGKYQIAYEKAVMDKMKAEENLRLKKEERDVGIQKQKIEIIKLEEKIAYQRSQIKKLSVKATVTGPVTYADHPWGDGSKIAAGTNVQPSWKILTVQAQESYQVAAWVHELDAARVDPTKAEIALTLDAYPGKVYQGKLISMSSQAEAKQQWSDSAYYRMTIDFADKPEFTIYPGMSVRVKLILEEDE